LQQKQGCALLGGGLTRWGACLQVTAILEAGRISLNNGGAAVAIEFDDRGLPCALKVAA
jgi:hypothetical protein